MQVTKLPLLSEATLVGLIKDIENYLPGYWWSIHQQREKITISVGASLCCILDVDRAWARTDEGDAGIIREVPVRGDLTAVALKNEFVSIMATVTMARKALTELGGPFPPRKDGTRHHDRQARHEFRKRYRQFREVEFDHFEARGYIFDTVHCGSCDVSADASLRGTVRNNTKANGREFDVSVDNREPGTLAIALDDAVAYLQEEIEGVV